MMRIIKQYLFLLLAIPTLALGSDGNYSIALGEADKDRLLVVNEIYNPFTTHFLNQFGVHKGDHVLEIGCGIGIVSQQLAAIVGDQGHVLATDINDEQLIVARSLLNNQIPNNLSFQKLSAYDLTQLHTQFDVIYVRFLLCHLPDPEKILRQVKCVLKPGGRFIIEDLVGNETLYSEPFVQGMEILQHFDRFQFEVQASDDHYFAKLPELLEAEGFSVEISHRSHPELDSPRKRTMLTYNLSSLKEALLNAGKISQAQYDLMYPVVADLVKDSSIRVFSYELGQILCIHK